MRAIDIVNALAARLPLLVDDFTSNVDILSLTSAGTTATATTSVPHGITLGEYVNISGASTPIEIISFTRTATIGTITTATDHDLRKKPYQEITISAEGSNEAEFNGDFDVIDVPNRRTLKVQMPDSGATSATGSPLLFGASGCYSEYSGYFEVTAIPNASSFEYELRSPLYSPASGDIQVRRGTRIIPCVSVERVIDIYLEKPQPETWGYVVLGDAAASKSRQQQSDAVDNSQRQGYYRQQVLQDVSFYVFVPTSDEIAAADARDRCQELFQPISQSILLDEFDTLLSAGKNNPLQFVSHGFAFYERAFYAHGYSFQQVADMGEGDTIGAPCSVAFKDISLVQSSQVGDETISSEIDLDDEPIQP